MFFALFKLQAQNALVRQCTDTPNNVSSKNVNIRLELSNCLYTSHRTHPQHTGRGVEEVRPRLIPRLFCVTDKANLAMSHHPIPLVPRRLLARCGGHARESGVVRSLIKLNNIISLVRERSLLRSLVHYFSWGKRACSHGHYSVFRVSPYSATPLQGCIPPHTENHWPMNRRLSSSHKPS